MEWTSLLSTTMGALIALAASALAERRRWLRESEQRTRDDRRAAYVAFLNATAEASEILINIARGHDRDETSLARAGTVLRDSNVLPRRLELSLVADDQVVEQATLTVALLRTYRDTVARGLTFDTEEFQGVRTAFNEQRDRLTQRMRGTL
ncbi:hypothetical protein OHB05_37325 [Streptomyces sp. NBC_00638]|uniref:hypothetical protein n=1 Tax=unclassified Streptomyces TaxID=2593676 RepID=UPI00224C7D1A|nr:hypothetical protein [Streptomyces sp. NBC_00638]MCX5008237.1 hypothetical protein [Streptomyces sp. NBC_00638]